MRIIDCKNRLGDDYIFVKVKEIVDEFTKNGSLTYNLGIGDVTLPIPKLVSEEIIKKGKELGEAETFKGYPPTCGYPFLKKAVTDNYKKLGVNIGSEEVFISDGGKSSLFDILNILPKSNVVLQDPTYPAYRDANLIKGNKITYVSGDFANNFLPSPKNLIKKPYLIYICSPNNPTGSSYNYSGLKEWVDFAIDTHSFIIYDRAYASFLDDGIKSIYQIEGGKNVGIEISSLSKDYSFTGVRCGYVVLPKNIKNGKLNSSFKKYLSVAFNGVSYLSQCGGYVALKYCEDICKQNIDYYLDNQKTLDRLLTKKGYKHTAYPSPYIWCYVGKDSWQMFNYLLSGGGVITTPGNAFGVSGKGFLRFSCFLEKNKFLTACDILDKLL